MPFDDTPRGACLRLLAEAVRFAPSADNCQPVGMIWDGERLEIRIQPERLGGVFPPDDPATAIALGAAVENLEQASRALGLAPPAPAAPDAWSLRVPADARAPDASLGALALFGRHTNRMAFSREPLPPDALESIRPVRVGDARVVLLGDAGQRRDLTRLIRTASEVRFRYREVHEWFVASLRFTPEEAARGDGLDVATLPLPPGGRLFLRLIGDWRRLSALNRLGLYRALAAIETQALLSAPMLAAVVGPDPVDGGRLMERCWIDLNARGVAVQPYYVLPDLLTRLGDGRLPDAFTGVARDCASRVRSLLDLDGARLHMVLRLGMPGRAAVRSRRLPVERLIRILPGTGRVH